MDEGASTRAQCGRRVNPGVPPLRAHLGPTVVLACSEVHVSGRVSLDEPVGAPGFAADAVVHVEQAARVVVVLDRLETGVVLAPERGLPVGFEKVGLIDVGSGSGGQGLERRDRRGYGPRVRLPCAACGSWPAMPG